MPYSNDRRLRPLSQPWLVVGLLLLLMMAGLLRIVPLRMEAMSGDEVFSREVAVAPLAEGAPRVLADIVHPPLYYAVLKVWAAITGSTEYTLRLLSLLFGLATVLLTAHLALTVFRDSRIAFLASVLVAFNDPQIHYSQEMRSYALFSFLVLLLMLALWRALKNSERRMPWILFGAVSVAVSQVHYVGWLYIISTAPVVLWLSGRKGLGRWVLSLSPAGVLFGLWVLVVLPYFMAKGGLDSNLGWISRPSLGDLGAVYAGFNGRPLVPRGISLTLFIGCGFLATWLALSVSGRGESARKSQYSEAVFVACPALLPPLALFVLVKEPVNLPIWGLRHVLPSQALWAMLVCAAVFAVFQRRRLGLLLAGLLLVVLQLLPVSANVEASRRYPYDRLADYIVENAEPTQSVFTTSDWSVGKPVNFYLAGRMEAKTLGQEIDKLPRSFWLLYRPGHGPEAERARELKQAGWQAVKEEYFDKRGQVTNWGTRVVYLSRTAPTATE